MTSTSQDVEELRMFPSTHEIEEIFDEDFVDSNEHNISQESDQLPVSPLSTVRPDSHVPANSLTLKYCCRFLTFILSIPFATILLLFSL